VRTAWLRDVPRRLPFTLAVVGTMLVLGVVTGTLWDSLEHRPLFDTVAYGLPAFQAGRWYTVVTGAFFALTPAQYIPVAGGFLLLVGWAEWQLGTRRAAIAAVAGQALGVLLAALVLLPLSHTGWTWAVRIADDLDVGFSAGALAAVGAATVVTAAPWRSRIRLILLMYAAITFLYIGVLWDLEHVIGVGVGLLAGPLLTGRAPRLGRPRLSRHEWRVIASTLFVVAAVTRLVLWFSPADGPLGASTDETDVWGVLLSAAISLALANGLRKGSRRAWRWALGLNLVLLGALVAVVVAVALFPDDLGGDAASTDSAVASSSSIPATVVDIMLWALQLAVLIAGRAAFRSPSRRSLRRGGALVGADDRAQAIELLERNGGTTLSWMGTWSANSWFFPPGADGRPLGYVAFQSHGGVGIALGDPVAADATDRAHVLDAFVDQQEALGQRFCLFSVSDEVVEWATQRGFRSVHVAEEAVIDLPDLEFRGKSWQDVRTALNRAAKDGISYREGRLAEMPRGIQTQVRAISEMWVSDKGLPEMGFTLGGVDEALDPAVMVGLAIDDDTTVHGITSWLPVYSPGGVVRGWTLDVMRRLPDGFRPVTEFLIASACLAFQQSGAELVSLSGAPLAHAGGADSGLGPLERLLDGLGQAMEPLYGFRSLESFKQKFQPRQVPLSMVFRDEAALPRIGVALTKAYLPDTSLAQVAVVGIKAQLGDD
jgi:phosphatidylglycerol lysyltransferase